MVYRVAAGIGSQNRFKAVLAQTIHKTSSSTPTWHECMELVFKLSYQVQQLELYVVNYAYFLFCSAQGKMSKKCKGWLSLGGCSVCKGLLCQRGWLSKGLGWEPVACCCVAPSAMWEILSRRNSALGRARELWEVQKHRKCFLLCQLVSTHPCLVLSPVRWEQ